MFEHLQHHRGMIFLQGDCIGWHFLCFYFCIALLCGVAVAPCVCDLRGDLTFCSSRAMSPDEQVYLGILAASIPIGFLFRYPSEYLSQFRLLGYRQLSYRQILKMKNMTIGKIIWRSKFSSRYCSGW